MKAGETVNYLDAHSHRRSDEGFPTVVNLGWGELGVQPEDEGMYSVGIHPWKAGEVDVSDELVDRLRALAVHERVVAIGECGLDRLRAGFPAEQEALFIPQVRLAEEVGKPLIVHCVRAYGELVRLSKALKVTVPLLVHGYNGNAQIAAELLRQGFYLSLGPALLNPRSNAAALVSALALDRLLLETDDSGLCIVSVYEAAANLRGLPLDELKEHMYRNFTRFFALPSGIL